MNNIIIRLRKFFSELVSDNIVEDFREESLENIIREFNSSKSAEAKRFTNAVEVFSICQKVSRESFELPNDFSISSEDSFSNKNETCFYFTALLISCSAVYSYTHFKDNIEYNPYSNQLDLKYNFYNDLVSMIKAEAEKLSYINMQEDLNNWFDGETYFPELAPNVLISKWLLHASFEIVNHFKSDSGNLQNLKYNLFEECGRLEFKVFKENIQPNPRNESALQESIRMVYLKIFAFLNRSNIKYDLIESKN